MRGRVEGLLGEGTTDKRIRKKTQSVFRKAALRALWAMARGLRPEAGKTSGARGRAETGKIRYVSGRCEERDSVTDSPGGGMNQVWVPLRIQAP